MSDIVYKGKPLADFDLWQLELAMHEFLEVEKQRNEASKHEKFNKETNKNAMEFPPPNPEYLKLKQAILDEIQKRKTKS